MYTTISTMAFYVFRCHDIESDDPETPMQSYLRADYSIDCNDVGGTRGGMIALAVVVLFSFSFGIPILFGGILWKNRSRLQSDEEFIKLWGTLFVMYVRRPALVCKGEQSHHGFGRQHANIATITLTLLPHSSRIVRV
mgnify:CR=1 FL=1